MSHSLSDRLRWTSWSQPKRGYADHEYEDAFSANPTLGRFAVADGASESAFAGDWARCLVRHFALHSSEHTRRHEWYPDARHEFDRLLSNRSLPWYLEEHRRQGAHAAFLGVTLTPHDTHTWDWQAIAVGDCCLLHLRDSQLLLSFPLTSSRDFTQLPHLIDSRWDSLPVARHTWGGASSGDLLVLMTDALAQWALTRFEAQLSLCPSSPNLESLIDAVHSASASGELRNDDLTMILIELLPEIPR